MIIPEEITILKHKDFTHPKDDLLIVPKLIKQPKRQVKLEIIIKDQDLVCFQKIYTKFFKDICYINT